MLTSCVKSFLLPIAYMFMKEVETQKLLSIFEKPHELIRKWIEFTPKFTDDASKISYLGLLSLLKATARDNALASLRIQKGGLYAQSSETILLQTKLIHAFAEFLEFTVPKS